MAKIGSYRWEGREKIRKDLRAAAEAEIREAVEFVPFLVLEKVEDVTDGPRDIVLFHGLAGK